MMGDDYRVRRRKLSDYMQNPDNPVAHNPRNMKVLVDSIHAVGAARSGLAKGGKLLAGNLTWESMVEAGIENVIEVTTDGKAWVIVNRPDLTEEQARQAAYYDQRSGELADWDMEQLLADIEAGMDLSELWFKSELDDLLDGLWDEPPEDPGSQVDRAAELQEKWQVKCGQVWEIPSKSVAGQCHRLMCGDATVEGDVERLMGERRHANLVVADPPYGVGIDYGDGAVDTRDNTQMLAQAVIPLLLRVAPMVFWVSGGISLLRWYYQNVPPDWLVAWYKGSPGHRSYIGFNDWEAILVYGKQRGVQMHDYLDVRPSEQMGTYGHPVPKPIAWATWFVERASDLGDVVLDPFLGSGTTMVAAEQTGRLCYGMEIEPKYVSVALERMAGLGLEPRLISDQT